MFHIICNNDFEYSNHSNITCTFYCETQNGAFPDDKWTDFAVNVLEWWSNEIMNIHYGDNVTFKLRFEDGPYWIEARKQFSEVYLHFATEHKGECTILDETISFDMFVSEVEKALRHLASSLFLYGDQSTAQHVLDIINNLRKALQI